MENNKSPIFTMRRLTTNTNSDPYDNIYAAGDISHIAPNEFYAELLEIFKTEISNGKCKLIIKFTASEELANIIKQSAIEAKYDATLFSLVNPLSKDKNDESENEKNDWYLNIDWSQAMKNSTIKDNLDGGN